MTREEFVAKFLGEFWKIPMYDVEAQRAYVGVVHDGVLILKEMFSSVLGEKDARIAELEKELAEEKEYSKGLKHDLDVASGCVDSDEYNEALKEAGL